MNNAELEKRKAALDRALLFRRDGNAHMDSEDVLDVAEFFYEFLTCSDLSERSKIEEKTQDGVETNQKINKN